MGAADRLAIGLAAVGRPAYINVGRAAELPGGRSVDEMRKATWDLLDAAYTAGIRWVDAARSYGRAEEFLAGWLAERPHGDVRVSSKWGYAYVGDWRMDARVHEVKEHTLARFQEQYEESRRLIGQQLVLYQVHSLTFDSPLFEDQGLQDALSDLSAAGVEVGFSTSGPQQADTIRRAVGLAANGQRVFTSVQSTWNPLETSATDALREANEGGLHVLVKEPLANGRLAVRPPEPLRAIAEQHGVGSDAVALAAALSQGWADKVLIGAVSPAQLESNLGALTVALSQNDFDRLAGLALPPERYWAERAQLPWA
jgi:aryl-alcohol dehydrogenase-like predicted oxidoreductase